MNTCPFQVGDRIHEMAPTGGYVRFVLTDEGITEDASHYTFLPDWSKPDATVTAIIENGFTYEYDYPIPHGRAEWGEMCTGGDCYPEGYRFWRKIE